MKIKCTARVQNIHGGKCNCSHEKNHVLTRREIKSGLIVFVLFNVQKCNSLEKNRCESQFSNPRLLTVHTTRQDDMHAFLNVTFEIDIDYDI